MKWFCPTLPHFECKSIKKCFSGISQFPKKNFCRSREGFQGISRDFKGFSGQKSLDTKLLSDFSQSNSRDSKGFFPTQKNPLIRDQRDCKGFLSLLTKNPLQSLHLSNSRIFLDFSWTKNKGFQGISRDYSLCPTKSLDWKHSWFFLQLFQGIRGITRDLFIYPKKIPPIPPKKKILR